MVVSGRQRWLLVRCALLFGATGLVSACAAIMGLDDGAPILDPSLADAGAVLEGETGTPSEESDAAAPPSEAGPTGCTTDPVDSCPLGRYCASNECASGCKSDDECKQLSPVAPFCNLTSHRCITCRTTADCTIANQECSPSGTCADRCTGEGGTCLVPTQTCCNKLCIDVSTDIANCNGCGLACTGGDTLCCAGQCRNPQTSAAACGSCTTQCKAPSGGAPVCNAGACIPATCADVLANNPAAGSGTYTIDPDGPGGAAAFSVLCDMTTDGGGWTLVGRERSGSTGQFRFLNADTNNASGIANGSASGLIGTRFAGKYTRVWVGWNNTSYIRFTKPTDFNFFGNIVDTTVTLTNITTSDNTLAGWFTSGGGAKACIATRNPDVRPGDTSWAIKPLDDNQAACGCNSGSWAGRGAYYGGTVSGQQTACDGYGGGWAGVKNNGEPKGGITPNYETRIFVK